MKLSEVKHLYQEILDNTSFTGEWRTSIVTTFTEKIKFQNKTREEFKRALQKFIEDDPEIRLQEGRNFIKYKGGYTTIQRILQREYGLSADLVQMNTMYLSNVFYSIMNKVDFHISDTVSGVYNKEHDGFRSCMVGLGERYEVFDKLEDVKIAYLTENGGNAICARALIWKGKYYDRIYGKSDVVKLFEDRLVKEGYLSACGEISISGVWIEDGYAPYMDFMMEYDESSGTLSSYSEGSTYTLQHESGYFEGGEWSDLYEDYVDPANAFYSDYHDTVINIGSSSVHDIQNTYDKFDSDYYHDLIYINGYGYYYETDSDIFYCPHREIYCHVNDGQVCSFNNEMYHLDALVEASDGNHVYKDDLEEYEESLVEQEV